MPSSTFAAAIEFTPAPHMAPGLPLSGCQRCYERRKRIGADEGMVCRYSEPRGQVARYFAGQSQTKTPRFSTLEKKEHFSGRQVRLHNRRPTMSTGFGRLPRAGIATGIPRPKTNLPPGRHALRLLVRNRDGCTTTMLSAREVKVEPIEELIAVGFAIKKSDLVHSRKDPTLGRGRRPITRIAITDAGRLALPTIMT